MFCKTYSYVANPVTGVAEPTAQPTSMVFSNVTKTSFDVSFTAAVGGADLYLAVRRTSASPTFVPSDLTGYTLGEAVGDGEVRHFGAGLTFSETGLSAYTEYFYDIFSCNGGAGTYNYLTTSPLENSQRTLFDFGNALHFDGLNDFATNTKKDIFDSRTAFTISFLFKADAATFATTQTLFWSSKNSPFRGVIIQGVNGTKDLWIGVCNGSYQAGIATITTLNVWTHVKIMYSGSLSGNANRLKVEENGAPLTLNFSTYTIPASIGINDTENLTFGKHGASSTQYYDGLLDEFCIWSDDAGSDTYNGGLGAPPSDTNLLHYWKFNESNPSTTAVDSKSGINLTLTNFNFDATSGWEAH